MMKPKTLQWINPKEEMHKTVGEIFNEIAAKHGISTLKTRGRDSLDFHELSVASIREIMQDAFSAGYSKGHEAAKHPTQYA